MVGAWQPLLEHLNHRNQRADDAPHQAPLLTLARVKRLFAQSRQAFDIYERLRMSDRRRLESGQQPRAPPYLDAHPYVGPLVEAYKMRDAMIDAYRREQRAVKQRRYKFEQ